MTILFSSSCYHSFQIKSTELPKLNHAYSVQTGTTSQRNSSTINGRTTYHTTHTPILATSDIPLEQPDGRLVSMKGKPDALSITSGGRTAKFLAPFIVEPVEDGIILKSSNLAATRYVFGDITKAEVIMTDGVKPGTGLIAGLLIGTIVAMFTAFAMDH
jgi:hypothetical protein